LFKEKGVTNYKRIPISEDPINNYAKSLFDAAQQLHSFLEAKRTVYVHCTAGVSRCSTLAVFYSCLYLKSTDWKNP
jgi:hypothetical protein